MSFEHVDVVCGKSIVRLSGAQLRRRAAAAARVVVDVGAGDGRFAYRLAREHADWLCVAVDACAAGMRRLSWRASRKPSRGGVPNAVFVQASVASLPQALDGIADEIDVHYPWGSLLRAVVEPDVALLAQIARLGHPGAALRIRLNESAFLAINRQPGAWLVDAEPRLRCDYAAAGVKLRFCGREANDGRTSWGARLGGGRAMSVVVIEGTVLAQIEIPAFLGVRG